MVVGEYIFTILLAVAVVYAAMRVWEGLRFRGKMLVTCPETRDPAVVKVDVGHAALEALARHQHLELCECSRWPERADCPQDCLEQITRDPENHRVWTFAARWYAGKKCVCCGKPINDISHFDRSPALLDSEGITAEWKEVAPETLPSVFSMDFPLCWSCHITQTFVREHPELVVYRPWKQ